MAAKSAELLHRQLVTARTLEEVCTERLSHWYAALGEEAAVVGTFSALTAGDIAVPHYRGSLVVFWLRGLPMVEVFAALLAKEGSTSLGRLSGLHSGPLDHGVMPYVTNVIGPNLSTAAGMALGFRVRDEPGVVVAAMGDGTTGLGQFHESLNLSALLRLPIVWVCQNNQYSISTPNRAAHAGDTIAGWAGRYGMPSGQVDGNDVAAVREAVSRCIDRARGGDGPAFVEALTYRASGHFSSEPGSYRDPAELAEWQARDPLEISAGGLRATGWTEQELAAIRREVRGEVEAAWTEAAARADVSLDSLGVGEAIMLGQRHD